MPLEATLLHGAYRISSPWQGRIGRFGLHAFFALLLVTLVGLGSLMEIWAKESEVARLATDNEILFRSHFVPAGPIIDLRLQAERAIAQSAGSTGNSSDQFLYLVSKLGAPLNEHGAQLQNLDYRDGSLEAQLVIGTFEASENLKVALAGAGLAVQVAEESTSEDGVSLHLRIRGAGE